MRGEGGESFAVGAYRDHGTRQAFTADRRRDVRLFTTYGLVTLRLTYDDDTTDAADTAQRLKAGLRPARTTGTLSAPPR